MFISTLDLFRIGIGPSSSHTVGPMIAAGKFRRAVTQFLATTPHPLSTRVQCRLKGALAHTGRGHATDRAVLLGLHGYQPQQLAQQNVEEIVQQLWDSTTLALSDEHQLAFSAANDIHFDREEVLPEHPNGMILNLLDADNQSLFSRTYFSIGGGFITTREHLPDLQAPLQLEIVDCPYPFESAKEMLAMAHQHGLSVAQMKRVNEHLRHPDIHLDQGLDTIIEAMNRCIHNGLHHEGTLPGGLAIKRRAKSLYQQLQAEPNQATINDWLSVYAMAVNEENAAGHMVVTAPTNGAAGVIPAVLYYLQKHESASQTQIHDFLLTAAAIGGLIKHRSSISGAEVGCQGEVGSAAAMAAAGLVAARGGSPAQVEHAAEIALEHHLGMTCDPVAGLVQVPCIERNAFGAVKAWTAATLALRDSGQHFMSLDNCIKAMRETGLEMSHKYKETSLGGLAVSVTEC